MPKSSEKDRASVLFFPPAVPALLILAGVGLDAWWPIDPGVVLDGPIRYAIGGVIIAGALLGLGLWAVVVMHRSGQSENPWKPTLSIIERGPFRLTRNPMYLQMVIVCFGCAVLLWNVWILIFTPLCGLILLLVAILPEEAYLERKFGAAYMAYKTRVRRWI